jgi:two-component sensor histidine kinase
LSNEIGDIRWLADSALAISSKLGIHFIDTDRKTIRTLTTENGLPSNAVLDILEAAPQRFFFTTQSSLHSYNQATQKFTTYGTRDGILQESFAFNTGYQLADGRMLLGTLQNFFYFHPDSLFRNEAPPQVLITGFKVFDQYIPLQKADNENKGLHLTYNQNFFQIEYASLSYYDANKINYYYQLEGVDKDWIKAGKIRFASYTGVAGGNYAFKVKAERDDGTSNPTITTLNISITGPFWKSPWFSIGILLGIGACIAFVYRMRLNRLLAMQQVRARIAQDLHDDMGSTLSTIHILSELARQQVSVDPEKTTAYVSKINSYSQQMLQAIDDIVWSINPFNDSVQNLTVRMREFAAELLESYGISFDLQADSLVATQPIPMEARYDYFMIFKEAIHNAAKHANCTQVHATVAIQQEQLVLTIQDNGEGFDLNAVSEIKGGNGLFNMQNRAKAIQGHLEISSKPGSGTRIILKAPLVKSWTYLTKKR